MAQRGGEYQRLELIFEMLHKYLERAWSDAELAEELGTGYQNIWRIRTKVMVDTLGIPVDPHPTLDGKHYIHPGYEIRHIPFTRPQMADLYLAGRRLQQQTRTSQKHVSVMLEKVARALQKPLAQRLVKSAQVVTEQEQDPLQEQIFATLVECWIEQVPVRITHHTLHGQSRKYLVEPYQIEPSVWGDGNYLIGRSDYHKGLATFKISRIEKAVKSNVKFKIPDDFNVHELLKHAWGVWHADDEPVTVRLRFNKWVVPRVEETIWHPNARLFLPDEDGSRVWEVQVSTWKEMESWIRGWGSDVIVEAPQDLRDAIADDAKRTARKYGVLSELPLPKLWRLWAKTDKKTKEVHQLIYHMIDVGQMAQALWQFVLHVKLKQQIVEWLNLPSEQIGPLIGFWASLHDLGKASPAFQDHPKMDRKLHDEIGKQLIEVGLRFPERGSDRHARHEVITTWSLRQQDGGEGLLRKYSSLPEILADMIAQMLGGHHGAWPESNRFDPKNLTPDDKGSQTWSDARCAIVEQMAAIFRPPQVSAFMPYIKKDNLALTLLSAIVSIADWIGSDDEHFRYKSDFEDAAVYARKAELRAAEVLKLIDWETTPDIDDFDFANAFGFDPTTIQTQLIAALKNSSLPTLAIIEAQMGIGKTEMSLASYAHWAKITSSAGLYVAMPTTATSNQMFDRVSAFLSRQYGRHATPMLVHSQALLATHRSDSEPVEDVDREGESAAAQSWFLDRRKSLLWPFGVGTVDQTLMSILQTKHFFVRLLGLSHKVVIFDEVHAYDAYMSVLFERLLLWLRQLGTSVIVLSATLPDTTRQKLLAAYTGTETIALPEGAYPRLSYVDANQEVNVIHLDTPAQKPLQFDWLNRECDSILERLEQELQEDGCAAVICNTITRAQELYELVLGRNLCDPENVILFHARFPMAWREEWEGKVLEKFGPHSHDKTLRNPDRPQRAIVIATQVIEQSLDLDFDVMISELAPVDLLLQRAGRLHRHKVNNAIRKHDYCLLIAEPEESDGIPELPQGDSYVYEPYVLLRSWHALKQMVGQHIELPDGVSGLIEQVYGEKLLSGTTPEFDAVLESAKLKMEKELIAATDVAEERIVEKPSYRKLLTGRNVELEEDNPSLNTAFRALTRNDPPGVNVVCLHQVGDKLLIDPEDVSSEYDIKRKPEEQKIKQLLRHSLSLRHWDPTVETWLLEPRQSPLLQTILARWKRIAALRYHRVVIFEKGVCKLQGTSYVMTIDHKLGVKIEKE